MCEWFSGGYTSIKSTKNHSFNNLIAASSWNISWIFWYFIGFAVPLKNIITDTLVLINQVVQLQWGTIKPDTKYLNFPGRHEIQRAHLSHMMWLRYHLTIVKRVVDFCKSVDNGSNRPSCRSAGISSFASTIDCLNKSLLLWLCSIWAFNISEAFNFSFSDIASMIDFLKFSHFWHTSSFGELILIWVTHWFHMD